MENFAKRLRDLRLEAKLTVEQLAEKTKISSGAISYWENNKQQPLAPAIITLARFFNVTAGYLLGIED